MTSSATPNSWQTALGLRLAKALEQSRFAHAPQADGAPERDLGTTRWRLPSRVAEPTTAAAALREMLGTPVQPSLVTRCLQHYRNQLAADRAEDDLGTALAAYLGACRQALDHEALTPQRWQAITQWVKAWVVDELPWDDVPLAQRQDAFERFAVLTVALGEWTVQASRQGQAQQAAATWMARNSLRSQLGLDLPVLCAALRQLDSATAANPSVVGAEIGAAAYRQPGPEPV